MILTGSKIASEVLSGKIVITPFNQEYCNPNSYNFHLGDTLAVYTEGVLDPSRPNATESFTIPTTGYTLQPNQLYLGHIAEVIGSRHYVPIIKGISSIARLGLFIVITADLVDLGAIGQWTLQLHCVQPITVYPGMPIGQMTFWRISGAPMYYTGKYQHSRGPVASLSYKDSFFSASKL